MTTPLMVSSSLPVIVKENVHTGMISGMTMFKQDGPLTTYNMFQPLLERLQKESQEKSTSTMQS